MSLLWFSILVTIQVALLTPAAAMDSNKSLKLPILKNKEGYSMWVLKFAAYATVFGFGCMLRHAPAQADLPTTEATAATNPEREACTKN